MRQCKALVGKIVDRPCNRAFFLLSFLLYLFSISIHVIIRALLSDETQKVVSIKSCRLNVLFLLLLLATFIYAIINVVVLNGFLSKEVPTGTLTSWEGQWRGASSDSPETKEFCETTSKYGFGYQCYYPNDPQYPTSNCKNAEPICAMPRLSVL